MVFLCGLPSRSFVVLVLFRSVWYVAHHYTLEHRGLSELLTAVFLQFCSIQEQIVFLLVNSGVPWWLKWGLSLGPESDSSQQAVWTLVIPVIMCQVVKFCQLSQQTNKPSSLPCGLFSVNENMTSGSAAPVSSLRLPVSSPSSSVVFKWQPCGRCLLLSSLLAESPLVTQSWRAALWTGAFQGGLVRFRTLSLAQSGFCAGWVHTDDDCSPTKRPGWTLAPRPLPGCAWKLPPCKSLLADASDCSTC